ncbi:MAG: hypothetical protein J0I07_37155, partial [Myxococcales bacterium]|nr:hypothetical protein [Myxococcales bacterium]
QRKEHDLGMHITYVATKELFQALIRSKRSDNPRKHAEQAAPAEASMGEEAALTSPDGLSRETR